MPTGRVIDLAAKSQEIKDTELPAAIIYFGERVPVRDWKELFYIAIKCLYTEFPDTISSLCSRDPTRTLFLRTNTIDMVSPRKIASIIYLETERTPKQILKAIRFVLSRADVRYVQMRVEVYEPIYPQNFFSPPTIESPKKFSLNQKPVLHLNQSICLRRKNRTSRLLNATSRKFPGSCFSFWKANDTDRLTTKKIVTSR